MTRKITKTIHIFKVDIVFYENHNIEYTIFRYYKPFFNETISPENNSWVPPILFINTNEINEAEMIFDFIATNVKNQRKIWRDEFWKELEEVNHHHHFWVWFDKLRNG